MLKMLNVDLQKENIGNSLMCLNFHPLLTDKKLEQDVYSDMAI
jgi:hypothetical protein